MENKRVSVAIDKFNYQLIHKAALCGAVMFTREHFEKINWFSKGGVQKLRNVQRGEGGRRFFYISLRIFEVEGGYFMK